MHLDLTIRPMAPEDLSEVSALGIRSKASWGYDNAAMRVFAAELTLTSDGVRGLADAQVAVHSEAIAGYFTLRAHANDALELEHLFVDPAHFGRGIGTQLLESALASANQLGASEVTIFSDPNAIGFYQKHGALVVGRHASSISGRHIPVLTIACA